MNLNLITQSADLSNARIEVLNNVEHLVIPTVAAVNGVMNGGLLTMETIEASLPAWEGVAVTMAHPTQYGENISANTQFAIENFVVGRFFNARIDGDKFKGEFWINMEQLEEHEHKDEFLAAVEAGETIEVSTAYWCGQIGKSGIHNGEKYTHIQTGLVPNHVAILLHEEGACSVAKGCGTPRTNQEEGQVDDQPETNEEQEKQKNFFARLKEKAGEGVANILEAMRDNRISHGQTRNRLHDAISEDERSDTWIWVIDVFDDEVIYGRELASGDIAVFSRKYGISAPDYDPTLEDPVEVQQVVTYEPVSTNTAPISEESHMDREALIERLATNEAIPFNREALTAMGDGELQYLVDNIKEEETPPADPPAEPAAEPAPEAEPVQNSLDPKVALALNALGEDGIKSVLDASAKLAEERDQKKTGMVSMLVANERCTIPEGSLRTMDVESLEGVARMAGILNYSGAGGPVANAQETSGPGPSPGVVLSDSE